MLTEPEHHVGDDVTGRHNDVPAGKSIIKLKHPHGENTVFKRLNELSDKSQGELFRHNILQLVSVNQPITLMFQHGGPDDCKIKNDSVYVNLMEAIQTDDEYSDEEKNKKRSELLCILQPVQQPLIDIKSEAHVINAMDLTCVDYDTLCGDFLNDGYSYLHGDTLNEYGTLLVNEPNTPKQHFEKVTSKRNIKHDKLWASMLDKIQEGDEDIRQGIIKCQFAMVIKELGETITTRTSDDVVVNLNDMSAASQELVSQTRSRELEVLSSSLKQLDKSTDVVNRIQGGICTSSISRCTSCASTGVAASTRTSWPTGISCFTSTAGSSDEISLTAHWLNCHQHGRFECSRRTTSP